MFKSFISTLYGKSACCLIQCPLRIAIEQLIRYNVCRGIKQSAERSYFENRPLSSLKNSRASSNTPENPRGP